MITSRMTDDDDPHVEDILEFTIAMFATLEKFNEAHNKQLRIRVGINSGPVVAGVIGKRKWAFGKTLKNSKS